jgi:hypothetical protein
MSDEYDAREAAERAEMAMDELNDKIARLERIEAAARELIDHESKPDRQAEFQSWESLIEFNRKMDALRQALGDGRE